MLRAYSCSWLMGLALTLSVSLSGRAGEGEHSLVFTSFQWAKPRLLDVMKDEPRARNVWAPELVYDDEGKRFLISWSSTIPGRFPETDRSGDDGYNHRVYATRTADFEHLEPARLLFDPGYNVIDASIVRAPGRYLLFFKDERRHPPAKDLHLSTSRSLLGPYEPRTPPPITGSYWAEGPTAIELGGRWFVYFDRYTEHRYGLVTSADLVHWTDESDKVNFPRDFRHGSVVRVPRPLLDQLIQGSERVPARPAAR